MKSDLKTTIMMFIIFVVTVGASSYANYNNGRITMCQELGKVYTSEKQCVTCEESGREIVNGMCMLPQQYMEFGGFNGTIL